MECAGTGHQGQHAYLETTKMDNEDLETGDPDESKRELTAKQLRFAAAYADPNGANGNATLAARMAGYKGGDDQLGVQGSVNLKNKRVRQTIAEALEAQGCTLERAAVAVAEATRATKKKSFLTKNGDIVHTEPEPDHKVRLLAAAMILRVLGQQHDDEQLQPCGQPGIPQHQEADPGTPVEDAPHEGELMAQIAQADRVVLRSLLEKLERMCSLTAENREQPAPPVEPAASNPEKPGGCADHGIVAQLDPADRVLFERATKIEAELADVDRELDDGGHGTNQ
jgi:hypothetical protein